MKCLNTQEGTAGYTVALSQDQLYDSLSPSELIMFLSNSTH